MRVLSLGRKIPWSRARQLTPVFLPGKSHGCRRLVGYRSWGFNRVRHNLVTKKQSIVYYICTASSLSIPLFMEATFRLLPFPSYCKQFYEHWDAYIFSNYVFFSGFIPRSGITGYYIYQLYFQNFKESPYSSPQWLYQFTVLPIGQKSSHPFSPSLAFIICRFFDDGHSNRCQVKLHYNFDLHLSNNQ